MTRKAWKFLLKIFLGKPLIGGNAGQDYDCLCGLIFDFEETLTSFRFKHLIKFLSLLMWIVLPKVFYQLICILEKIEDESAFNMQLQCIL